MKKMNIEQILQILPQKHPFLMIDYVDEIIPGKSVTAIKNVSYNEPYFSGHFPDLPIMPGVLIIEALAQTGVVGILSCEEWKNSRIYLTGINNTRFKKMVRPGDVLKLKTEITEINGSYGKGIGTASVNGEVVCSSELWFVIDINQLNIRGVKNEQI